MKDYICSICKDNDIMFKDSNVRWNYKKQEFEVISIKSLFGFCWNCEEDREIILK